MQNSLIWIDMEMTGLDPARDCVLEIASLVTGSDLEVLAEGPNLVVWQPGDVLAGMDEWNRTHHAASGLLDQVRASTITVEEAEKSTLEFLSAHCTAGTSPLCGNSVWQDRRFLDRYMPALGAFCHYRIIDVSSIKELYRRWYPELAEFPKVERHRALDDIRESVAELKYYRKAVFREPGSVRA